jgi:two-component system response regulator HydG
MQASGGTLFLDEIGELPLRLQPKLLRALQERKVRSVGGSKEVPCDVRIIAATNRNLEEAIDDGSFRADLFYRIHVIHVEVPPLRRRGADILLHARHFIEQFATASGKHVVRLTPAAAEKLLAYSWPGNIRELQNCIERAVALTRYEQVTVDDLPERIRDYQPSRVVLDSEDPIALVPLEEMERRHMLRVLAACGGNKTLAARILGVNRRTLTRKFGNGGDTAGERDEIAGTRRP